MSVHDYLKDLLGGSRVPRQALYASMDFHSVRMKSLQPELDLSGIDTE
jgi:hypothetical protein